MTEAEVRALLTRGETNQLEWKAGGNPERIARTLAAFANDYQQVGGGTVICGVAEEEQEDGGTRPRLVGLDGGQIRHLQDKIFEQCQRHVRPALAPTFDRIPLLQDPTRQVLLIWSGATTELHEHDHKVFIRVHDRTCGASDPQRWELVGRKGQAHWLEQPAPAGTVDDLNLLALEEFIGRQHQARPVSDYLRPEARFVASALPLVHREARPLGEVLVPHRFALLLFGREPTRFFSGAYVVLLRFDGPGRDRARFGEALFHGPIPKLVADVMGHLQGELSLVVDKTQDFLSGAQNRPRYAEQVLRECLVNALVHRDYQDSNPTRIAVFSDRIEFDNPGGVSGGGRIEELARGGPHWRNPALARYMVALGLAQEAGSGLSLIETETRRVSGQPARITAAADHFEITVPAYEAPPRRAVSGERSGPTRAGAGVVLVSVGAGDIRGEVEACLPELGLEAAEIAAAYAFGKYVESGGWQACARDLRNRLRPVVEDPRYRSFHFFYKGPVVLGPLCGALFRGEKPLTVYYHDASGYHPAYTIDKKFLNEED